MERKYELCGPFLPRRHPSLKTSAEIVSEARRILRAQSTQRPCTPRDGQRQLFASPVRADHNSRPSSTFSLHAQSFDVSESRPTSGSHLSPLEHKSRTAIPGKDEVSKSFPKPPTESVDTNRGLTGTRARLLRATSLTTLPPLAGHAEAQERLKPGVSKKLPPPQSLFSGDHNKVYNVPHKPGPRRTQSESRLIQPNDDPGVTTSKGGPEFRTDLCDGKKNTSTDAESKWDRIAPLLQQIKAAAACGCSETSLEHLCNLCVSLHDSLAEVGMLGRHGCKKRSTVLRTLFGLIDLNSSPLDLHVAELCLALCVSGNNLLNICKLVFQISRNEDNDVLFQDSSVIDLLLGLLLREEVSASGEALFYCVGTLKFLSGNAAIVRQLLDKNCMRVAQKFIKKLCRVEDAYFKMARHIFVQLTATMRNLADHPEARSMFVSYSLMSQLCLVLQRHSQDQDVCTNVSRIFSKLSSYAEGRLSLAETPDCYQLFLELLSKHHQKQSRSAAGSMKCSKTCW